jgi:adenosylmethionine-8-amino-7-oxononanoate aminotransferase
MNAVVSPDGITDGETVAARTVTAARRHGLIVRAMGDTVVLAPPLISETFHFAEAAAKLARALDEVERTSADADDVVVADERTFDEHS